jgi:hypothetical protein
MGPSNRLKVYHDLQTPATRPKAHEKDVIDTCEPMYS